MSNLPEPTPQIYDAVFEQLAADLLEAIAQDEAEARVSL
jgi:hypothetical protein